MNERVRIPTYCSAYRKGERTGTVIKTGWLRDLGVDKRGRIDIARIKLDMSGKTVLIDLGDCEVLSSE